MKTDQSRHALNPSSEAMSLEEARSVMWLRNNHRPLGELLDEGYLNEHRLAWAAEKAYNPRLKEAAAILLAWVRREATPPRPPSDPPTPAESWPEIQAGLTVEQARATRWPFKSFKNRPMGDLVDTRQVGLKDLAYAIENAWDQRVRQAAIVLMAVRLNQVVEEPTTPAGSLRVVSEGKSYSERKQLAWTSVQGMIVGALLVLLILGLIQPLRFLLSSSNGPNSIQLISPGGMIALLLLLALGLGLGGLAAHLFDTVLNKTEEQIENYRRGQEGEDRVVEAMRQNLDGNWTLFRNVTLPGRNKTDIDLVLVGPAGVWALEVKTFTGEYRNVGGHWEYKAGNRWKLSRLSPSQQAQNNAARLSSFLKAEGIKQWVTPAVVWANRESCLTVENPMVAVWTMDRLPEELGNIWQEQAIKEPMQTRIVEKLTTLCQSRNSEEAD